MRPPYRFPLLFILALSVIGAPAIRAGWLQEDIPVCTDPEYQLEPIIVADGTGNSSSHGNATETT